jgi:thiamine pyrophosphate-dependent acetolactate synthase large subunit-like protein
MEMREALRVFAGNRDGAVAMVSSGQTPTMWEVGHEQQTMYFTGMSYSAAGALGFAMSRPDLKTVAVEGDGAMLMGMANLATIGRYAPKNLTVLVMNNQTYLGSFQGYLDSATVTTDLPAVARATGFTYAETASTPEDLDLAIKQAMATDGPTMVVANVDQTRVLDAEMQATRPDRTDFAMEFDRWVHDHPLAAAHAPVPSVPTQARHTGNRFGKAAGPRIYAALKKAGIDFIVYLPDGELYPVLEEAEYDPEMMTVACNREDEGIAIAGGAVHAGRKAAILMEGTGVGFSGLIIAHEILSRVPMLIVSSHSQEMGIRLPHNDIATMVNEPILRALNIHTVVLRHLADAELYITESQRSARVLRQPAAVVIPPHVMAESD